jgi:hypothetical protein
MLLIFIPQFYTLMHYITTLSVSAVFLTSLTANIAIILGVTACNVVHIYRSCRGIFLDLEAGVSSKRLYRHTASSGITCCICRLGADNAFPPGQELKEYCRAEAMGDLTGVSSCTAVNRKQNNLLCWLPRRTDRQWRTQEFFSEGGGFNKFSWGQRAERTGIWGR